MIVPFRWIKLTEALPALEEEVAVLVDTSYYGEQKDFGYLWQRGGVIKWELASHSGKVLAWWLLPKEDDETEQKDPM